MSQPRPALDDVGVLAMVPDLWGPKWQVRHHVLTRLTRYFHVVWMEPALWLRDALSGRRPPPLDEPLPDSSVQVYQPGRWLPQLFRPLWAARLLHRIRLGNANRLLKMRGCRRLVLYLWRPLYAEALHCVRHDLSCYHIDDDYSFGGAWTDFEKFEPQALAGVDQVFIHSPGLIERKGSAHPHVTFAPNGVDYETYARSRPEPADLAGIPRPRIGYAGYLKPQLDWPLIARLAERHSDWSFVFVGAMTPSMVQSPQQYTGLVKALEELSGRPNVHFLGAKTTLELIAYPEHFDVCAMPYVIDEYTHCIYPMKLHEALAAGRPVVGSKIRSLVDFAETIRLAEGEDEWSEALAASLEPAAGAPELVASRRAVAKQHDWSRTVDTIAETIAGRLGPEDASRLQEAQRDAGAAPAREG